MVKSEIDEEIVYNETKIIDPADKGHDSYAYTIEINNMEIDIVLGREKYTYMESNIISFPIYIVINNKVKERIGIFELEGNLVRVLDEDGDIDINKGNILIFSYVTMEYLKILNKEKIDVETINVDEFVKGVYNNNENNEDKDNISEEDDDDDDDVTKIKNLKDKKQNEDEDELKDGIFVENLEMKKKPTLKEERESDSKDIKKGYEEKINSEWINKFLKNNNYGIIDNGGGGDCFFASLRDAFELDGKITTIKKLRALLSEKASDEKFMHYKTLYKSMKGELDTINKNMNELRKTGKILKKQHETVTEKETGLKVMNNAKRNLTEFKRKELEKKEVEELLEEFDFMENVDSFEDFRLVLKTQDFWADMWAIATLEDALNIKVIILSEESYYEGDLDSVMLCGHLTTEEINRTPEYYIMVSHTGNHYKLITYKEKGLLKFKEIPYDIKMLIVNKCMEKNSGPYYLLKDFRELKMNMGISSDEGKPLKDDVVNYELFDPTTVFRFYDKSDPTPKAGKGSGEEIPEERIIDFNVLNNDKTMRDWRRKLDDSWKCSFTLNDKKWASVDHYYYGSQYKKGHPDFYEKFSIDANSELSLDPKKAKAVAIKGKYEKKKIRPDNVKPDPDFFELGPNQRSKLERYAALKAKFEQNADLKKVLIETKDAKLVNFVRSVPPIVDLELMNVRKEIINTENS